MIKRFKKITDAIDFAEVVKSKVKYDPLHRDGEYVVEWFERVVKEPLLFEDMWEHYRVQYKDSNTNTEELYSIEALGFLKALRLLYPEYIRDINKEIATILSQLMIKVLGDDKE